ncbi:MAG: AAA family ATPase, partial [Lachnospiraceae bacterium]|nr:AAA family ATPase [Lachnospiraceae bacterium]
MKRLIEDDLLQWKQKKNDRMPLLLYGARQVGKTWLLQDFGKRHYQNSVYVNFERMSVLKDYFEGDLSPDRLLGLLEAYFQTKIHPGKTLLIFDEIQACERALTSLKYFCEDAPDIHVAAAGSLLGVAVHRQHFSFPVGKVLTKTLYPFRFDEFLSALSRDDLVKVIREHFADGSQMPKATHAELRYLLKTYLFVGGMPAVIRKYLEEESLINIPEMQGMILDAYTADMSKYATEGESTRIRGAFHSLPAQLAKENR